MSLYKIQGNKEKLKGIYYEFDSDEEPLGKGGMGMVYKGRCVDESTGNSRNVAVKFMYSDLPQYAIEKARREAAIQFRHDNLVEMLGFIETEDKSVLGETMHHYHVVSELLEGVSLDKLFEGKLTDQKGNFVPFAEKLYKDYQQDVNHFAVEIIKNILSGLMMMHDAGYIHRDIDPTNIMITSNGKIKLIDFGIAKKMNSLTTHDKHLTQAGQFVGKPEYAAPELVLGAINEQDQTTDIYAVGILLFQCLVGHVPFEGDRSDILQKQLHSPLPLKLIKHRGLRKIIETATSKSRVNRFQSAAEFRVALDRLDLNGDVGGIEWRPLYNYIIGGVVVCAIAVVCFKYYPLTVEKISYDGAIALIKNGNEKGVDDLKQLSSDKNDNATYMLSRLYFKSGNVGDLPDSIRYFQKQLKITANNKEAHNLLEKAVNQNPENYYALFELACDFWRPEERTGVQDMTPEQIETSRFEAINLFNQALQYAQKTNDKSYINEINEYLVHAEVWKKNLNEIKSKK